uniref:Uncharacterized protein n=1 Tax=Corethron hystrix TaxID=216773 RepID=A0A7S1BAK2_9STRA|mmetsp:Transcript_19592/g.44562  ORF Transcript_19592/g.44562 Transcript_19592/m.44562 type:complete len:101 (+) Transcript_19592:177-479(+)
MKIHSLVILLLASMLNQFAFCFSGVALGASYTILSRGRLKQGQQAKRSILASEKSSTPKEGHRSSVRPLVMGGISGSVMDIIYGYNVACVKERDRYHAEN